MIVTIDGPNSAGKGTLASRLAEFYGFTYFDTGMVYRAVAVEMFLKNIDFANEAAAEEIAKNLTFERMTELSKYPEFRGPAGSNNSAVVASYPKVRAALLKMQQDFAKNSATGVVYDGRDTGTTICPDADIKIFVTAAPEVRADRRYRYYQSQGVDISYEQVLADVTARDERDMNRAVAPLKPAEDAIILDTSNLNADEAFVEASELINSKLRA
ncbi:MAG: (d)CMP kinase [Lactobacillaceae bacterium]|jgi:cytidylate kinase|nr:(d)CMP kinase [Lactobacillaceae bacterium]